MENMIRDIMYLITMDQELDIINIANITGEDLGYPLPHNICKRQIKKRNQNYFEVTISHYTDVQFLEHFGMSRGTFELNRDLSVVCGRFNLAKSIGHKIFTNVISTLAQLMPVYIKWLTVTQCHLSSKIFEARSHGFPGVIAVMGSYHISCRESIKNSVYCNKKSVHSIILQGVCDHQGLFVDCFIEKPGCMHNAQVFKSSPLFNAMKNGLIPCDMHIIGDSTYPLLQNLMIPFKDNGRLTQSQLSYNTKLSTINFIVKRALQTLRSKFRYLDILDYDLGNNIIAAACVLHNFILNRDGLLLEDRDFDIEEQKNIEELSTDVISFVAFKKRKSIAKQF